ncbi:MAG: NUDIX domain-containing protein [Chloroflexi bacterium]|nr:NUDIX domain-containing protein [Chloroflexota bacterium]
MKNFENVKGLQKWLHTHNIDTSLWGEGNAKTINNLWDELTGGEIAIQDDPPLRLVNVVQILIRKGKRLLLEAEQEFGDGQRRFRNQPPSEKMKPGENYVDAAVRCLQEELAVSTEDATLLTKTYKQIQRDSDSLSYPGLKTVYTFHIVEAQVKGLPEEDFWQDNQAYGGGDPVRRHLWIWQYGG